jgi:hypothetical protein
MIFGLSFATFLTLILVPIMLDTFISGNDKKLNAAAANTEKTH